MQSIPVQFKNTKGETLSGLLEVPEKPVGFGIFAHCFTCTKNITAAHVISKTLSENGFAVLRFDFSGLGESEGEFSETSLTSNIDDIKSAARFLEVNYEVPSFLIGHSLGGLACLYAAQKMENLKACITLNAPSSMAHFKERLSNGIDDNGNIGALLDVMGKKYPIKNHFVNDTAIYSDLDLTNLKIPLLVIHLKDDDIVPFHHAHHIMEKAAQLKQLIILENMNHLLTKRAYCEEVVNFIEPWLRRFF
jgi:alpha/beta superfamily hydrolase